MTRGQRRWVTASAVLAAVVGCSSNESSGGGGSAGAATGGSSGAASGGSGGTTTGGNAGTASPGGASGAGGSGAGGTGGGNCAAGCTSACEQGCFDLGACAPSGGVTLDLEGNVTTFGVVASLSGAPATATLHYRAQGSSTWWQGPPLVRLPDGRLAGSAFWLTAGTAYEVRVEAGGAVGCDTVTTQAVDPAHATTRELWVDATAPAGGSGTSAAPFDTLGAAVAAASAGTDVHVRAGVYREEVTIDAGGAAGSYLRIVGEPGAVLDGSDPTLAPTWRDDGDGTWSTPWSGDPRYVARDGARLYHYLSLADLDAGVGLNSVPIAEGFFVSGGRLHVRIASAPAGHAWQIPTLGTAIAISGANWVWIEGLEIRFYGEGDYAKGIDVTEGADHVVIRGNHVHDVPSPIWIRKGSSHVRVEDNEVNQSSVGGWPWPAVKATDHENSAISLAGGRGAIVARNVIHDLFNGVYAGSFDDDRNPALAYDVDVSANRLTRIGDDGFEPEGAAVNARFWDNTVDVVHNGVSLAPITYGPVWVLRNRFTDYDESGFKVSNDSSGRVWLLHNTCFTDRAQQNGMNVSGSFANMVFRNNLIRGTSYALESTQAVGSNDLDYDALFTTRGAPRVKWDDVRYDDLAALCSATTLECHGVGDDPRLPAPGAASWLPGTGSPLIDAGEHWYGINDGFAGAAPDIGYVEVGSSEVPPL